MGDLPFAKAPAFSQKNVLDYDTHEHWWTSFNDSQLNQRIDRALTNNFTLVSAWERLNAANAIAKRERSGLFPALDGSAGVELQDGNKGDDNDLELSLGLEASYEVDLWGRIQSRVQAENFRAAASAANYQVVAITLSSEVALTWYQICEARLELELINSQIETNQAVLEILQKRFAAGQLRSADILRQRQLIEATREQAVVVQSRLALLENRLAVLEGRPPQQKLTLPEGVLPDLAATPRVGLPAALLQRRPDVQEALLILQSADRDLASAVSDQYPRLNITASITTAAENPAGLFREWLASLAGQLTAPLFDAGQRKAEVERNEAIRRQRLAEYGQVVLNAFREVEDALARERFQLQRLERLEKQLELAKETNQQLRTQYLNGVTDYIAVLTAIREQQQLERDVLNARLARIEIRIALHRALAGGFKLPQARQAKETDEMNEQGTPENE